MAGSQEPSGGPHDARPGPQAPAGPATKSARALDHVGRPDPHGRAHGVRIPQPDSAAAGRSAAAAQFQAAARGGESPGLAAGSGRSQSVAAIPGRAAGQTKPAGAAGPRYAAAAGRAENQTAAGATKEPDRPGQA